MTKEKKIKLIHMLYSKRLNSLLEQYDISRSSFYNGYVEREKLDKMYDQIRNEIMEFADTILEIETIDYIENDSLEVSTDESYDKVLARKINIIKKFLR